VSPPEPSSIWHVVTSTRPVPPALHRYTFPSKQCSAFGVHSLDLQVPLTQRLLCAQQSVVVCRLPSSPQTATKRSSLHVGSEPGAHSTHAGPRFVSAHVVPAGHAAAHAIAGSSGGDVEAAGGAEETGALEDAAIAGEVSAGRSGAPQLARGWHTHARKRTAPTVEAIARQRMLGGHVRNAGRSRRTTTKVSNRAK
jgi:hypothetical protein